MIHFGVAGLVAAFAAGFVSFLSPCVFPLVPGYLTFISGVGVDEMGARPKRVVSTTAAFIVGFGSIFVLLGAGAAVFGDVLLSNRRTLEIVAGVFIAFTGLIYAGVRLPVALLREKRFHVKPKEGFATPVLVGVAFGVGWTPCIGPTLAAILALSAASGDPGQGAILLAVYSIGLGIPFLLFGLGITRALGLVTAFRRHQRVFSLASGSLLVVFGILIATGYLTQLTARLSQFDGTQI